MLLCLSVPSGAEAAAYSLGGQVRVRSTTTRGVLPLRLPSAALEKTGSALLPAAPAWSLLPQTFAQGPVLGQPPARFAAGPSLLKIGGSPDVSLASTRYFQGSPTPVAEPVAFQLNGSDVRNGLRKANSGFQSLRRALGPQSPVEKRLRRWVWPGLALGSAVPVLFKAAPFHFMGYVLPAAALLPVAVLLGLGLFRLIRHLARPKPAAQKPAGRPATWRSAVVGLALGLSLAAGAIKFEGPIVETAAAVALPGMEIRHVPGSTLEVETIAYLRQSEGGREILDRLRDRSGRIRMPTFFVAKDNGSTLAYYNPVTDGVFIASDEITARGWTVEQFLSDPALQRQFAGEFQHTFAHELMHANQSRRSIFRPGQFKAHFDLEWEYEAFIEEHFHTHERLTDDPLAELTSNTLSNYKLAIADLDGFLKNIRNRDGYKDLPHSKDPYFDHYFAKLRASWPAHQVEGLILLGRRAEPTDPLGAAGKFEQALALADSIGKPVPGLALMTVSAYTRYIEDNVTLRPYTVRTAIDRALALAAEHGLPDKGLRALKIESFVQNAKLTLARTTPDASAYNAKTDLDSAAALAKEAGIERPELPRLYVDAYRRLAEYWKPRHPGLSQSYLDKAEQIVIYYNLLDTLPPADTLGPKP